MTFLYFCQHLNSVFKFFSGVYFSSNSVWAVSREKIDKLFKDPQFGHIAWIYVIQRLLYDWASFNLTVEWIVPWPYLETLLKNFKVHD